ncbi:cupredoxin domain-containing protein [Paraburkholderia dilworthii]|uniref:cupredoxin domain-containing protein n=1 Tax=Paraburkholderia dilworthii TaxID=948106 RepID=UPI000488BB4F|nr:cupredoxin family copper-binding protein [Paraburkholderia dilworthii]
MVKRSSSPGHTTLRHAALACAMLASLSANAGAAPKTYVVAIENMQFDPSNLTVKRGDRVVWINKDVFPHTVTAGTHAFDSRSIAANASWSYEPVKAGSYSYGCTFHPTMHGALTVQ